MSKLYKTMLAMLCIAGMGVAAQAAGPESRSASLNTGKQLQTVRPNAKKQTTVELKGNAVVTDKAVSTKGKQVRGARKADSSTTIEGLWTFQLGDYYLEGSAGPFLADFEATLIDGTYVAFEDPNGYELPFGASFNSTTGVLTFEREYLGSTGTYYIYQEPYVFDYDVMDLIPQTITAAFIADEGVIEFELDNGISWVAYSDEAGTNPLGYFAIYDLEGAEKQVEWNSVGTGSFLENIVYGLFVGVNTHYASVEIMQHPTNHNLYKILNPFQDLYAALDIDAVSPAMVIDVTNPDNVLIELQSTGISASSGGQNLGTLYYFNEGWYSEEYGDPLDPTLACTMTTDSEGNATIILPFHSCTIFAPATSQFFYGSANESVLTFTIPVEPEYIGSYTFGLQPVNLYGGADGEMVDVTVEVYQTGEYDYYLTETDGKDYFLGQNIPFTYNASGYATFEQAYLGQINGKTTWFSPFVIGGTMIEIQNQYPIAFKPASGFTFEDRDGFGFFVSNSDKDFNPTGDYLAAYGFTDLNAGSGSEALTPFNGVHSFKADVTYAEGYNIEAIMNYLQNSCEFMINASTSSMTGFIGSGDAIKLTGTEDSITLETNMLGSVNTEIDGVSTLYQFGYAPEGEWAGAVVMGGLKPTWNIEEGHIVIPDFDVVDTNNGNVVASYKNISVDGYPEQPEQPGTEIYGLEGNWTIPLDGHYQGSYSLGKFDGKYEVTVEGNTVFFDSVDSDYNIIAEVVDATTLRFNRAVVVSAIYSLVQVPFINNNGASEMDELTEQSFTATYNAEAGTITFPANSGLAYGRFDNNGNLSYWDDAFDFDGPAVRTSEIQPELTISNQQFVIGENQVTVSVDLAAKGFKLTDVNSWRVNLTEIFSDLAGEQDWDETITIDEVTVENGVLTFVIPDLANGNHDFTYSVTAFGNDGAIATSNTRALSVVVGPDIMIRNISADPGDGSINVSFYVTLSGFNTETATYKALFTDLTTATDTYPGDTCEVDATIYDGVATAILTDLSKGNYQYRVALEAFSGDTLIAISNNLEFNVSITVATVVDSIAAENSDVRYFNLNGVEVKNPAPGSVVIRVEGSKVSKVVK